ncbi:MAG: M14 family metallopeptidase [Candidatus Eisenbacteria bacterium]
MEIRFDTYYDNDELAAALRRLAETRPSIFELRSLGTSHEGRDIPLVVVTNRETGKDTGKPGFWVDANIHATEVAGTMAAVHLLVTIAEGYGQDAKITRIVDEQVIYVAPRLNPDGAALALCDKPRMIRSGTRPYPEMERADGLHEEDADGDGRVLQMRIEDPAGDWKVSDRDPRLLVKRAMHEEGGTYYRLLPEGNVENFDGFDIQLAPDLEGLDFNRNFPSGWKPEGEQLGAGDFPGSEPEIRALLEFVSAHPNIFGAITFHTFSRVILRPFSSKSDDEMDTTDLWVYQAIGERGTELTKYPCCSVNHDFRYHPKQVIGGAFDDWAYEHLGVFAFTIELWDLATASGITEKAEKKKFIEWFRIHPVEDDYKILDFVSEHAPKALVPGGVQTSQLGRLEIGGWDWMYSWRNPPHALLEAEIEPHATFVLDFASAAPRLRWIDTRITNLGDGRFHVHAVVENVGFFSTSGSMHARKVKRARPVTLVLGVPDGCSLERGKPRKEIGHLEGRSNKMDVTFSYSPTDNRGQAEWVLKAPAGTTVTLEARSDRAGTLKKEIVLE